MLSRAEHAYKGMAGPGHDQLVRGLGKWLQLVSWLMLWEVLHQVSVRLSEAVALVAPYDCLLTGVVYGGPGWL